MAEEARTESPEKEVPVPQEKAEAEVEVPQIEEEVSEDSEPGGDEPQAVRARKEYRARKRLEQTLQEERETRQRLEGQIQAFHAQAQQAAPRAQQPVRFSPAQVQEAIDQGRITASDGADYLAEMRIRESLARERQFQQIQQAQAMTAAQALGQIAEYRKVAPWVDNRNDGRRKQLESVYSELITLGQPHGLGTEVAALQITLGRLEKLRKTEQVRDLTRNETDHHSESGGGGASAQADQYLARKMPKHFQEFWDSHNVSAADRAKEAKIYFSKAKR